METNQQRLKTYGKAPLYHRLKAKIRERFTISPYTEHLLRARGLKGYVPKLNKVRVALSVVGVVVCITLPLITPLGIPVLLWGFK